MSNYKQSKAINNSSLKLINPEEGGSPEAYKMHIDGTAEKKDTKGTITGSLIHTYELEPEKFQVLSVAIPGDKTVAVVDHILQNHDPFTLATDLRAIFPGVILQAANAVEYQMRWKDETRVNGIIKEASAYFEARCRAILEQKQIVDPEFLEKVMRASEALKREPASYVSDAEGICDLVRWDTQDEIVVFTEQEMYGAFLIKQDPTQVKGITDRLYVNLTRKEFVVFDLKTTVKHVSTVRKTAEFFNYDRQIAFYNDLAEQWLDNKYGEEFRPAKHHVITFVMTKFPYLTENLIFDGKDLILGREKYTKLLRRIALHTESMNWITPIEAFTRRGISFREDE